MERHVAKIRSISKVTHDVLGIILDRPENYSFVPGQATEIAIHKEGWEEENRPFTFTSLPDDDHLEFTIKTYPDHKGVTAELLTLKAGDELILHDVWGAISYKGEGLFIAGGAGVTPFLSILRHLASKQSIGKNKLLFANKTKSDIIHESELSNILGNSFINILSNEVMHGYHHGLITEALLKENIDETMKFYVCGPPPMMDSVQQSLANLGVSQQSIVVEI